METHMPAGSYLWAIFFIFNQEILTRTIVTYAVIAGHFGHEEVIHYYN
jgi:hypothetical protein